MSQTKAQLIEGLNINSSAPADALVIDSSGRVGIGVSSPGASLDVESASDQTALRLRNNGGNNTRLLFSNKAAGLGEIFYQGDFRFVDDENSDAERMRIDSSGRLLVGTTTEGAANADNLTVADSGHAGITIRSGTSSKGAVFSQTPLLDQVNLKG